MSKVKEIFERVADHLLKQGKQCIDNAYGCKYRLYDKSSETMLKCAVGCLIPDELYDPHAEDMSLQDVCVTDGKWEVKSENCRNPTACKHLAKMLNDSQIPTTPAVVKLLRSLQSIHDAEDPANWKRKLNRFRKEALVVLMEEEAND